MAFTRIVHALLLSSVVIGFGASAAADGLPVGLLCVSTSSSDPTRRFSINFDINHSTWTESEPGNTKDLFKTKSGRYIVKVNSTSLLGQGDAVVGLLDSFNPDTANDGDQGRDGKAMETGRVFDWTVTIPHQSKK